VLVGDEARSVRVSETKRYRSGPGGGGGPRKKVGNGGSGSNSCGDGCGGGRSVGGSSIGEGGINSSGVCVIGNGCGVGSPDRRRRMRGRQRRSTGGTGRQVRGRSDCGGVIGKRPKGRGTMIAILVRGTGRMLRELFWRGIHAAAAGRNHSDSL
jgi:hypothetical protein